MRLALLIALLALLCSCQRRVTSCSDDLSGVWKDRAGNRYEILDRSLIRIFPLFDTTRPASGHTKAAAPVQRAPFYFDLHRRPTVISGSRFQRYTKGAASCRPKTRAELTACESNTLTITYARPEIERWSDESCSWKRGPTTSLQLRR